MTALCVLCIVVTTMLSIGTVPAALGAAGPTGEIPSSIIEKYLSVRPPLGDVTVVHVSGEPSQRKLLAATLQGVVNRSVARIYLVGARNPAQDQYWIDQYVARGLIDVVAHDSLDEALATFAHEATGYVVASPTQPWTINTATTVAGATKGLVATPDEVALLQSLGLTEIDNHIGRWTNAADAYESIATTYRDQLAYAGLAIQSPTADKPRDFFVQQGIMTVSTRPSDPDYDRIMALLAPYPTSHPVYGYIADNGTEEVQAIARLSQHGRFLVPTDTTDNLSFHLAVGADAPRATLAPRIGPVAACTKDQVNVVIATSDGDNMVIPEAYLPSPDRWGSAQRGSVPIGWGISPATAVLMPSVWDFYARTATADDEIVGIMGLGYSIPTLMPDAVPFLSDSNRLNAALGIDTVWSLDLLLGEPTAAGWADIAAAHASTGYQPDGYLLNYLDFGGPPVFTGAGLPVAAAQSTDYDAGASALAAHIETLLATSPAARPLVSFLPVTVWNATYDSVVAAIGPYADRGVRFLTPREAFACLATETPPTSTTTTTTTAPAGSLPAVTDPARPSSNVSTTANEQGNAGDAGEPAPPARPIMDVPAYTG